MRPQHLLRSTKSDSYPSQVISLDCDHLWEKAQGHNCAETAKLVRWVGVGFSGAAGDYGPDRWAEGSTVEEFWHALSERIARGGCVWIFSERASLVWSLLNLWEMVECRAIDLCGTDERMAEMVRGNRRGNGRMRVVLEDPPFIIEFRKKPLSGTVKVLDVANYGLPPSAPEVSASERVIRVSAFVRGMVGVLQSEGLGSLKDTVGTQSYSSFKRRHLTHLIQCHSNVNVLNLEGDSYYGGRCEAFRLGRLAGPVYHLDVSAMYPFCARENHAPVSLAGCANELGGGDHEQLGEGCGLIADVSIDTDEPAYPYRMLGAGITVWPIGAFRTVLAGPELLDAAANDRITRWHRAAWYDMAPALRGCSQHILDLRRQRSGDSDLCNWIKGLGVCLIGKFGQKDRRWVDAHSNVFHPNWGTWWQKKDGEEWTRWRAISGYSQTEVISSWSYDAVPAIASWVCSAARMRLLNMIRCAGWQEISYCDTDAIMTNGAGFERLTKAGWIRDGEPGFLRVKNVSDMVAIHGVKSYDEEGRSCRAGQPLSAARIGIGGNWYWTKRTAAVACREGRAPDAGRVAVRHERTEPYRHGEVCADGSVTPFQLNEG